MQLDEQINKISRSLFGLKSFYSYFKNFKHKRLTWQERVSLRKTLVDKLQDKSASLSQKKDSFHKPFLSDLLKPGTSLKNPFAAVSISHCPVFGGFVCSFDKNVTLGLDVELIERPGIKILSRVSTKEEIKATPSPASSLWTAKEAAFKCAHTVDQTLNLLNECVISEWRQTEPHIRYFSFQANKSIYVKGQGFLFLFENKALALTSMKLKYTHPV